MAPPKKSTYPVRLPPTTPAPVVSDEAKPELTELLEINRHRISLVYQNLMEIEGAVYRLGGTVTHDSAPAPSVVDNGIGIRGELIGTGDLLSDLVNSSSAICATLQRLV